MSEPPFTSEELPPEWYFLFKEADLTSCCRSTFSQVFWDLCQGSSQNAGVAPAPHRPCDLFYLCSAHSHFHMEMVFLAYLSTWLPALHFYLKVKNGSQGTNLSSFSTVLLVISFVTVGNLLLSILSLIFLNHRVVIKMEGKDCLC